MNGHRTIPPDDAYARAATGEQAARDAVRGLSSPRTEPGFRARLRHEFTTGRFGRHVPPPQPFAAWYVGMQWPGMAKYQTPSFDLIPEVKRVYAQLMEGQRNAA